MLLTIPKVLLKLLVHLAMILLVTAITSSAFVIAYLHLPGSLLEKKILIIPKGTSKNEISKMLAQQEIIYFPWLFKKISKFYSLKSGEYQFTRNITPAQILEKLVSGKSMIHRLLIPEGLYTQQIIEMLNKENRLFGTIHEPIPEGYLMPSTYFYSYGDTVETLVNQMRNNMSSILDEAVTLLSQNSPIKTRKEILILASIVEKEAGSDEEKPKIAAVFLNRLKIGMKLQSDPTVIYAITSGKFKLNRKLNRSDLSIDSPYNTYKVYGLPLGAIAAPGEKSIMSVIKPANIDDLYFVVDGKGGHNFAKTLKAHNKNIRQYKKTIKDQMKSITK